MNPFNAHTAVNIPAAILGGICFGFAGWYYYFQPRPFHRTMDQAARQSPSFVERLRFFAKPIGIVSFLIAAFLLAVALKGIIT